MDLVTLALAQKNGGSGEDKAMLIVRGEYVKEYGNEYIYIEQSLADIYNAAQAGRAVFLEWTRNDETPLTTYVTTKRLGLETWRKGNSNISSIQLTFSGKEAYLDEIRTTTVKFWGQGPGTLTEVIQHPDDITMYYDHAKDAWCANPYELQRILESFGKRPINVKAYDISSDPEEGQIFFTVEDIAYDTDHVVVSLTSSGNWSAYEVYEDGTVIKTS